MFQYKIMNNILFLNKLLFKFKKVPPPLCSFCNSADETPFISSLIVILQNDYGMNFSILFLNIFIFLKSLHRLPFSVFLILAINNRIFLLINHLLLLFKFYLYMSREHETVCFTNLKLCLIKIKTIEQNVNPSSSQKKEKCRRKSRVIENILK